MRTAIASLLLLAACESCHPPPSPAPTPDPKMPASCADLCAHARAAVPPWPIAAGSPHGGSCEEVCGNNADIWNLDCRARAATFQEADACER